MTLVSAPPRRACRISFNSRGSTVRRQVVLRDRTLLKTKSRLFRLRWGQLLSAKRADIEARSGATHHQGHACLLYRDLSANRASGGVGGRVRTEETCPPGQPLIQSFRTVLPVH